MEISPWVMSAVLASAILHASWNVLLKASRDPQLDTVATNLMRGLLASVAVLWLPLPAQAAWPWIVASALVHIAYFHLLARAYQEGEMTFAYPIMRGGGPLISALAAVMLFDEHLGASQVLALVLICGGILAFATLASREPARFSSALRFALANAVVIAAYTLIDAQGVRLSGAAFSYVLWFFVLNGLTQGGVGLWRDATPVLRYVRAHWLRACMGALCSIGAYGTALWAMTQAPVALVACLRETAVVFGAVLAALFLGERLTRKKIFASTLVLLGLLSLRLPSDFF